MTNFGAVSNFGPQPNLVSVFLFVLRHVLRGKLKIPIFELTIIDRYTLFYPFFLDTPLSLGHVQLIWLIITINSFGIQLWAHFGTSRSRDTVWPREVTPSRQLAVQYLRFL